jgi:hypothetical protein
MHHINIDSTTHARLARTIPAPARQGVIPDGLLILTARRTGRGAFSPARCRRAIRWPPN